MQRSVINYKPITPIIIFIGLILYESIVSLYLYITPLAGFIFLYMVENYQDKSKRWLIFLLFIYLVYYEIDKGFLAFGSGILFLFYTRFVDVELRTTVACNNCFKVTVIVIYYISFYILNLFASLIFNYDIPKFDISYIIYIISDSILVLL